MAKFTCRDVAVNVTIALGLMLLVQQLSPAEAVDFVGYNDKWCKGNPGLGCKNIKRGYCCDIPGGVPSVEIKSLLWSELGFVYTDGGCKTKAPAYPIGPLASVCYSDLIITGVMWDYRPATAAALANGTDHEVHVNGTVMAEEFELVP